MKIVIDISKEDYDKVLLYSTPVGLLSNTDGIGIKEALLAIIDGKVLPKGHGELIDKDVVLDMMNHGILEDYITDMVGVISADKGAENETRL